MKSFNCNRQEIDGKVTLSNVNCVWIKIPILINYIYFLSTIVLKIDQLFLYFFKVKFNVLKMQ
jgi:hypothetical protein